MEKLVYLVSDPHGSAAELLRAQLTGLAKHTRGLTLLTPAVAPSTAKGGFGAALFLWLSCLDRRTQFENELTDLRLSADGYLLTESLIQRASLAMPVSARATLVAIQQVPALGQTELRTQLSKLSSPLRKRAPAASITRDFVVRPLQTTAAPLRALFTITDEAALPTSSVASALAGLGPTAIWATTHNQRNVVRARIA